jgi:nucleoside-diphosphate kinase
MERTLAFLKPNAIQRSLVGEIISMIEEKGLKIVAMKLLLMNKDQAEKLYREHADKDFFDGLMKFVISGPVIAVVLEGSNAVKRLRHITGNNDPLEACPGTIRGRFGVTVRRNLIHSSDSVDSAAREISIFFKEEELIDYVRTIEGEF